MLKPLKISNVQYMTEYMYIFAAYINIHHIECYIV